MIRLVTGGPSYYNMAVEIFVFKEKKFKILNFHNDWLYIH